MVIEAGTVFFQKDCTMTLVIDSTESGFTFVF